MQLMSCCPPMRTRVSLHHGVPRDYKRVQHTTVVHHQLIRSISAYAGNWSNLSLEVFYFQCALGQEVTG